MEQNMAGNETDTQKATTTALRKRLLRSRITLLLVMLRRLPLQIPRRLLLMNTPPKPRNPIKPKNLNSKLKIMVIWDLLRKKALN